MSGETDPRALRVLVVDDHEVTRMGLIALLERSERFDVIAGAGSVSEAVEAARTYQPDLVVMDVRLPDGSGIEATRDIRAELPGTRVVILTSYADEEAIFGAIQAGASGFLLKGLRAGELLAALEAVGAGGSLLDPAVTRPVLERIRALADATGQSGMDQLNAQERRILDLVAEGRTNREIGGLVSLSERTVKNYVSSILRKLKLQHRAQTAAYLAAERIRGSG